MSNPHQVGGALERAVRAIEEMVIRSDPGLSRAPFSIRPNAIITRDGMRYEIDILVTVNEGSPYQTIHLFECKNRKEPVSQADVTILADKVRELSAARGTLISREFTSCAKAKAASTGTELVPFDDAVWFPLTAIQTEGVGFNFTRCQSQVFRRTPLEHRPDPDWKVAICRHRSRQVAFSIFVHELATAKLLEQKSFHRPPGTYTGTLDCCLEFDEGELLIGDWDVCAINVDFDYAITIRTARLVSTFSVEKRGRFARFECEPDEVDGTKLAVEITGHSPSQ